MRKVIASFWVIVLTSFVLVSSLKAQIPREPVNIQSPNAASLGRYGEYPVSYFTGVPQIEIPLYSLKEKEISVPITLSYHASGFRPDEHPGWVGQGWSLNVGGMITRVVNQKPDEDHIGGAIAGNETLEDHYGMQPDGYFYNYNTNTAGAGWNTQTNMTNIAKSMQSATGGLLDESSLPDTQPDEFSFNFNGYSGTFYLNTDGTWKIKSDKPITITPLTQLSYLPLPSSLISPPYKGEFYQDLCTYSPTIAGFTITTDDGTKYVFGGITDAIEYSVGMFTQNTDEPVASSWYLTQIISKNTYETVNFSYTPDNFIDQLYVSMVYNQGTTYSTACESSSFTPVFYGGKLIRPVYLQSIKTSNFEVDFSRSTTTELGYAQSIYDDLRPYGTPTTGEVFLPFINTVPVITVQTRQQTNTVTPFEVANPEHYPVCLGNLQWKELDNIIITDNSSPTTPKVIKQFNLNYTQDNTVRLTLNSVTETDANGIAKPPYVFSYHQSTHPLPAYLAFQTDHWGFWNGTTSMANSAPDFNNYVNNYYTNRQPSTDLEYAEAGVLTEIKYPTGGVTDFTYELNHYGQSLNTNRSSLTVATNSPVTGGLRIFSIKSSGNGTGSQPIEKDYYYVSNYNSGYIPNSPQYVSSGILGGQAQYEFNMTVMASNNSNYVANTFTTQSVLPASNNGMGSHIGYSEVVEKRSDGSYSKFLFSNFADFVGTHYDEPSATTSQTPTIYQPFTSLGEERGKLLREETHNPTDQPIKTVDYRYAALDKANQFIRTIKTRAIWLCPQASTVYYVEGSAYGYYTYSYLPISKTTALYDSNGLNPVSTVENYYYDNPLHKQVTRSTVLNSKGETLTTVNIYPQDYASGSGFIDQMVAINNVGTPVETAILKSSLSIPSELVSGKITEYLSTGDYPSVVYSLDLTQPIATTAFKLSNQVTGSAPFSSGNSVYTKDGHYRSEANFDYYYERIKDFNIYASPTVANLSTAYLWDVSRRYPIVEVKNANFQQIAFTSFEENENINSIRANNPNNWNIPAGVMTSNTSKTGHNCGNISGNTLTTLDQLPVGAYTLSYWSKAGAATISAGNPAPIHGITTADGWTYYEHTIQLATSANVSVSGNTSPGTPQYIDDLRLYPSTAQMSTYTYDPLVGMTSSTDAKGEITYYEYDTFQRLMNIRDKDHNVIKHMDYHYQGQ